VNILFVLIPLSLVLLGVAIWALFWAVDSGQFEDLDVAARAYEDEPGGPGGSRAADGATPQAAGASRAS
jgi:cbb3-type cytochrome oxidase maturation protein